MYGHPAKGYGIGAAPRRGNRWRASTRDMAKKVLLVLSGGLLAVTICAAIAYVPSEAPTAPEVVRHG